MSDSREVLKRFKPTSPGVRFKVMVSRKDLHKGRPLKSLTSKLRLTGGRNSSGRMTSRRTGGGLRVRYRKVDFLSRFDRATVRRIEYDPNRSCRIALMEDDDGNPFYCLAEESYSPGKVVVNGSREVGSRIQLKNMKEGDSCFALSQDKHGKAKVGRSAGTSLVYVSREGDRITMKMPSKELKIFSDECWATLGRASNPFHYKEVDSKAGTAVRKNRRPIVRGMAQDARAHPMGGKGQTKGKRLKTRWGKLAKGVRTRNPRKNSSRLIVKRRYA